MGMISIEPKKTTLCCTTKSKKTGFIYFIRDGEYIKIGWTKGNPKKRQRVLSIGNPRELKILAYIHGDRKFEKLLHRYFNKSRFRGEWFNLDKSLKSYIDTLNNVTPCHFCDFIWNTEVIQ